MTPSEGISDEEPIPTTYEQGYHDGWNDHRRDVRGEGPAEATIAELTRERDELAARVERNATNNRNLSAETREAERQRNEWSAAWRKEHDALAAANQRIAELEGALELLRKIGDDGHPYVQWWYSRPIKTTLAALSTHTEKP